MKHLARALVAPIRLYQRFVSPLTPDRCKYHPSCSEYAATAVLRFGPLQGLYLGIRRLLRCHPWSPGGVDEVPEWFRWRRPHHQTPPTESGLDERTVGSPGRRIRLKGPPDRRIRGAA